MNTSALKKAPNFSSVASPKISAANYKATAGESESDLETYDPTATTTAIPPTTGLGLSKYWLYAIAALILIYAYRKFKK